MKYIRTKEGKIFDASNFVVKREIYENGSLKFYEFWTTRFIDKQVVYLGANEILKQADTIKELCDEFVRVSKSVYDFLVSDDMPTKKFDDTEIYGAIWTDKGLIYVAKMNEEGELELLWKRNY